MESFSGDNEEGTEDVTKRKSSKIKFLKSRFFRRAKKTGAEADAKLSQSASDITVGKGLGSDEDLASQGAMGSRAFSHESIFLDDQVLSDPDPVRVSSQENVHSKIKSLQMKLQLQKMHFGPPPMVLPVRSPEETAQQSEDFTFHGSNENSGEGTLTKSTSQPTSPPVLAQTRSPPRMPSHHFSFSGPNYSSPATAEAPVDFNTPAEFTASLDTSALRHRMSIKPRNQRASSKRKPSSGIESGSPLRDLKVRDRFELVQEQEKEVVAQEGERVETDKGQANLSQLSPLTFEELSPVSSEVASKLPSQDNALPEVKAFPILRVKPPGQLDASATKRPHSSYIDSEIKEKKESYLESQLTSQNKRKTYFSSMTEVSSEQLSPFSSWLTSRSPLAQQQQPKNDEDISTRTERQSSGSDSFHLSRNWDEEKAQSGSLMGLLENSKPRTKSFGVAEEKIAKEREELKSLTGFLEKPEARSRSFEGLEEKITREKEEVKRLTGFLEKSEAKTREFGGTEEKITREREDLKSATGFFEKPEARTGSFERTEEKITKEKQEAKNFTGLLENPEAKTRSFGGTEEKNTREREELKHFTGVLGKPEAKTRPFGGTEEKIINEMEEAKHFTEFLEKPEVKTRSFGGIEEKITKEKEEGESFLEKPEVKTRPFEEKKTRQREELKHFSGVLEKPEVKTRPFGGTEEKITREREEVRGSQPKGSSFAADRSKGSSLPWERNLNYKKIEPVTTVKNSPLDTYVVEAARVDGTGETVDEAVVAKGLPEDETRTPFGVKLRSTSRSFKFRSETASQRHSATLLSDDQDVDTKKSQKLVDCSSQISEKILANTSSSPRSPDPAPFGVTLPVRRNASLEESSQTTPVEVQTTSIHLGEPDTPPQVIQPSPQASSSDLSWMVLAMEKTRSLQHLLTSRFQRDFTSTQTGVRPKSQEEPIAGPQVQNQTGKIQQSTPQLSSDKMKEESVQSSGQEQAAKPSTPASQKKLTTQFESCSSRASPISRQMSQPNRAQSDNQAIPRTTHSPSPSSPLIGNTSPFTFTRRNVPQLLAQSYQSSPQQQTCWTSQGLQPATQLKHAPSTLEPEPAVTSAASPTLDFALERREKESSVPKESSSLVSKRVLWTGSAADRVAFMEKRAEWTMPPLLKEKKSQAQIQTSSDTDTLAYLFPLSKDTVEIRQVAKSAESSPSRVIEKPPEDKWTRKNVELPSSPSSLRTRSSALHSDSSQPSWMELAKRKSMAWSDKSMD
ncbi:capping protein-inhibiting regulator of actin dynamics isoform X2 [Poeciliopsis prolifica]|uniref:capping protein-inhibiting regulator of actin dynamics isoform X2 n=1 Tax=Poeciliopsis prolifica TaxID=188132 RepID=UPI00241395A8|nr:capping protein-inhibiting regulator of actin dynamics isoform X2 [Poeciliopsis prolifica]